MNNSAEQKLLGESTSFGLFYGSLVVILE